jgi:hypothetical protein
VSHSFSERITPRRGNRSGFASRKFHGVEPVRGNLQQVGFFAAVRDKGASKRQISS